MVLADTASCSSTTCTGTARADTITGTTGNDTISGRGGKDTIYTRPSGSSGHDSDTIYGGKRSDTVYAEDGDTAAAETKDTIYCNSGRDVAYVDYVDSVRHCEIVHRAAEITPSPNSSIQVGSHFHALWPMYDDAGRSIVFDKLESAGVAWVRIDLSWKYTEQYGNNSYNTSTVAKLHRTLDMAEARGINVLLQVHETPPWANGNRAQNVPPTNNADWADFARFLTSEFGGKVDAWEQWNEPNEASDQFWTGTAAKYTQLACAGYPAFKSGDPSAPVLAGSTSYADNVWVTEMYASGAKGCFDALAVHPYMAPRELPPETVVNGKWSIEAVRHIRQTMLNNNDPKPIWYTEFGWSSCEEEAPSNTDCVTDAQQGDYLTRAFAYIKANQPYVTHAFWYTERDRATSNVREANFGLLNQNSTEKPVYYKLKDYLSSSGG